MKKIKVIIVIILVFLGQEAISQKLGLNIKGGVNFNSTTSNYFVEETTSVMNFHLGLSYEIPIYKNILIEPGVYLDSKGFRTYPKGKNKSDGSVIRIASYSVPILAKTKITSIWERPLFFEIGPVIEIIEGGGIYSGTSDFFHTIEEKEKEIKIGSEIDEIKRFHYGFYFGAGFEEGRTIWSIGYHLGLTNIYNVENSKTTLNSLKLSVGYRF